MRYIPSKVVYGQALELAARFSLKRLGVQSALAIWPFFSSANVGSRTGHDLVLKITGTDSTDVGKYSRREGPPLGDGLKRST